MARARITGADGHWLSGTRRVEGGFDCPEPGGEEIRAALEEMDTPFGRLTSIRHAARLSETPAFWARPPVPLGTHAPVWPV